MGTLSIPQSDNQYSRFKVNIDYSNSTEIMKLAKYLCSSVIILVCDLNNRKLVLQQSIKVEPFLFLVAEKIELLIHRLVMTLKTDSCFKVSRTSNWWIYSTVPIYRFKRRKSELLLSRLYGVLKSGMGITFLLGRGYCTYNVKSRLIKSYAAKW